MNIKLIYKLLYDAICSNYKNVSNVGLITLLSSETMATYDGNIYRYFSNISSEGNFSVNVEVEFYRMTVRDIKLVRCNIQLHYHDSNEQYHIDFPLDELTNSSDYPFRREIFAYCNKIISSSETKRQITIGKALIELDRINYCKTPECTFDMEKDLGNAYKL